MSRQGPTPGTEATRIKAPRNQNVTDRKNAVKENYPHTFATALTAPSEVDLRRFWLLEQPLDLTSPFHRDTLWNWIQESIDRSCDWIDLRNRLQANQPIELAVHYDLLAEAHKLLAYKRACLAKLAEIDAA